jgi:hypothetical protein
VWALAGLDDWFKVTFAYLLIPYAAAAGTIIPQLDVGNTMYGKLRTEVSFFLGFRPCQVLAEAVVLVQFCG